MDDKPGLGSDVQNPKKKVKDPRSKRQRYLADAEDAMVSGKTALTWPQWQKANPD